jgi:hypothetical protein
VKLLSISFCSEISCAHDPGYLQTFISFALFDLSNRGSPKKSIFVSCSILTDSTAICVCLSIAFFLSSFDHETFEEVATVSYALMVSLFEFDTEPKEYIYYHVYTNVANRIV